MRDRQWQQAALQLAAIMDADQFSPNIAYWYGVALQNLGKLPDAIKVWQQCVDTDPSHVQAWGNLALAQSINGDLEAANLSYQHALEHHPHHRNRLPGWTMQFY